MTGRIPIALTQLVLWYDSTRVQTWPAIMARVDSDDAYPSTRLFGMKFCTDRLTKGGHSPADNTTKNLPGLETKAKRGVLRGVGLLEQTQGGYRLSDAGKQLGAQYRDDPSGKAWASTLGRLLLLREPRTRVFMRLMSEETATLYFTVDEWWGGSMARAAINYRDGRQVLPFSNQEGPLANLRSAINQQAWWALGYWRDDPQLHGATDCQFVGQSKEEFSLYGISSALRASCEVFLLLGVLRHQADRCWLDHDVAIREFGTELADDFGWAGSKPPAPLHEIVSQCVRDLRLDTGFVVASELRERLRQRGIENPDREIARLESEGRIYIEAADYGQSRHGVGLYDDPRKQLIKLRIS
jgi:hypothetical protein